MPFHTTAFIPHLRNLASAIHVPVLGIRGRNLAVGQIVVFLQAIFALLRRSLGSVLKAIFGWATLALFGEVPQGEQNLLTAVIAAAALWPFLAVGTVFPRQATVFLVVVPIPKGTPAAFVRVVWIALTVLVPIAVGWAISRHRQAGSRTERVKNLLRGLPATFGIAIAFLVACVAVPVRKLVALARGRTDEHFALAIAPRSYEETVERLRQCLEGAGISVTRSRPPWGTRVTGRILHVFAGAVLGTYVPERMAYFRGDNAEITFYPNGARISGPEHLAARVHAMFAEGATDSPALQCMSPEAQKIEKRLKGLPRSLRKDIAPDPEIREMARTLATADLPYDDWQILYRELLQVLTERAGASAFLQESVARESATRGRHRRKERPTFSKRRLRRTASRARAYGQKKFVSAAASSGVDTFGAFVQRMVELFAKRR